MFKMPERLPEDGGVRVERHGDNELRISVELYTANGSHSETLRVSPFNAARIFGMLALFLGINLPKTLAKAIKL